MALVEGLARYVEASPHIGAMVLVGSFANGTADAMSDLDLIFLVHEGHFEPAWRRREELHVTGSVIHWDEHGGESNEEPHGVGGHRWITPDLVVVESVVSTPQGGGRLAEPHKLVVGDPRLVQGFPKRPPIDRAEMTDEGAHAVDVAYGKFKDAVRNPHRARP